MCFLKLTEIQKKLIFNLRVLRNSKNLSQSELADKLSISKEYLNRIENGHAFPSPALLDKICILFEIKPAELFL